jgi:ABC-2 type transport system permease protein
MPIFDQGYQHWSGTLTGHAWRWLAIAKHGVRVSLREGKPGRSLRLVLLLSWLPALVLATLLCLWGLAERGSDLVAFLAPMLKFLGASVLAEPRQFRVEIWTIGYSYFLDAELIASMILVVMVGPDLISQDLRYNSLPLYFSRPLRRIDYFAGKLGVIVAFLAMVIIVPSIIAYVLGMLFSLDITILSDTFHILVASIVYGLVIAVSAGILMLALSSLSRNSRYISLLWFAIWIGTYAVSGVLEAANQVHRSQQQWRMAQGKAVEEYMAAEREASKNNWRPLVSYTANLSRVGRQLVGTDAAWERLVQLQPPGGPGLALAQNIGPQFPWYWSAAVLAALTGLSACILNFRIKSLDRLK